MREVAIQTSAQHFVRILKKPEIKKILKKQKYSIDYAFSPINQDWESGEPNVSCQVEEQMLQEKQLLSQLECEYQAEILRKKQIEGQQIEI